MSKNKNSYFPPLSGHKRPRTEFESKSPTLNVYDKFFKVQRCEGSFKEISPFLIHKALTNQIGNLTDTRKLSDGSLLIEVSNENQSIAAASLTKLHNYDVITTPHKSLNLLKGVFTCQDLIHCSDDEILENLKDQGVVELYRIQSKKNDPRPSATFIASFKLHQLPPKIYAGWYALRVRPFIPQPMRCFQCQGFGHTAIKCNKPPICPSCGYPSHSESQCNNTPICVNCNKSHSPRYKGCEKYKIEFEIQKIKVSEKLSYFDAKKKYLSLHPSFAMSFSSITRGSKPSQATVGTQCDLTLALPTTPPPFSLPLSQPPLTAPPHPLKIPVKSLSQSHAPKIKTPDPPPPNPTKSAPPEQSNKKISKTTTNLSTPSKPKLPSTSSSSSKSNNPPSIQKKKPRSGKSTPSSSSESILIINSSDNILDQDSEMPSAKPVSKK